MKRKRVVIDLRTSGQEVWHIKDSIGIRAAEVKNRLYELPDSKVCYIDLIGSSKLELDSTKEFLESRKWEVSGLWNLQDEKTCEVPLEEPPFPMVSVVLGPRKMLPLLCDPCPVLVSVIKTVELSIDGTKTCLDFGCGSGRDTMFLALRGFHVTAVDYEAGMLLRVSNWAQRFGSPVKDRITTRRTKLRKDGMWKVYKDLKSSTHTAYPAIRNESSHPNDRLTFPGDRNEKAEDGSHLWFETQYDCVLLSRFFLRVSGVFDIFGNLVKPGGYLILHHFYADDAMEFAKRYGHPKDPDRILQKDDFDFFKSPIWEILTDELDTLLDGRTVVNFVARKANIEHYRPSTSYQNTIK